MRKFDSSNKLAREIPNEAFSNSIYHVVLSLIKRFINATHVEPGLARSLDWMFDL